MELSLTLSTAMAAVALVALYVANIQPPTDPYPF